MVARPTRTAVITAESRFVTDRLAMPSGAAVSVLLRQAGRAMVAVRLPVALSIRMYRRPNVMLTEPTTLADRVLNADLMRVMVGVPTTEADRVLDNSAKRDRPTTLATVAPSILPFDATYDSEATAATAALRALLKTFALVMEAEPAEEADNVLNADRSLERVETDTTVAPRVRRLESAFDSEAAPVAVALRVCVYRVPPAAGKNVTIGSPASQYLNPAGSLLPFWTTSNGCPSIQYLCVPLASLGIGMASSQSLCRC